MWTDAPPRPAHLQAHPRRADQADLRDAGVHASSSRGETVASQADAAEAETNASNRTGAATSVGLVPGRRCTFRAWTSVHANR